MTTKSEAFAAMLQVLQEISESSAYWSDYDVPLGIHDRITRALELAWQVDENTST